jgi:hypothetical protein
MFSRIVKDSSIWRDDDSFSFHHHAESQIRIGVVIKALNEEDTNELRYLVEVYRLNSKIILNCKMLRRFGGAYNYEDFISRGYNIDQNKLEDSPFEAKAGDIVVVAFLNGLSRDGVILGGLSHPARKTQISAKDGPQYKSEFNGIEKSINKDGEYKVTFKGQPTNLSKLNNKPSSDLPLPVYDEEKGTSYYKFSKDGSFEVSDNAKKDLQSIKIDKTNGTVEILSGNISLKLTKSTELVTLKNKQTLINTEESIIANTKKTQINSSEKASIKSPKIAIGKEGVELLDQLAKLIDALGKVQPISPVGPCTPLLATGQWAQVEQIKAKIKEITGTF